MTGSCITLPKSTAVLLQSLLELIFKYQAPDADKCV